MSLSVVEFSPYVSQLEKFHSFLRFEMKKKVSGERSRLAFNEQKQRDKGKNKTKGTGHMSTVAFCLICKIQIEDNW